MRAIGIDYGSKRIGIALSDPLGMFAQPLETLENAGKEKVLSRMKELISQYSADQIVIGYPRNMDGTAGPAAAAVDEFVEQLKGVVTIPIALWDERLTTRQVERILVEEADMNRKKRKESRDKMAAGLILQSYLDSRESGNPL